MKLNFDLNGDELKVFMEETDEQIQLLDENIIKLEKDGDNPDLLQVIFRAAHTLKGSSAMIGHKRMADVTHAMESLLDKLRNNKLKVNSRIVDALLFCLDALKALKQEVITLEESDFNITPVLLKLTEAEDNHKVASASETRKNGNGKLDDIDAFSKQDWATIEPGYVDAITKEQADGNSVYQLRANISNSSDWKAVRCFQVLNELAAIGKVIASNPSKQELEQEKAGAELAVLFCSTEPPDSITIKVKSVGDIEKAVINPFILEQCSNVTSSENQGDHKPGVISTKESSANPNPAAILLSEKSDTVQSVRVDVKVLDKLMNMIEELVIDRSRINQVTKELEIKYHSDKSIIDLQQTSSHIMSVVDELYQDIMKARMIPISTVFNKFPRLVRDLAQKESKDIDFVISGENTELDRTIIEHIRDPLIHLLRNAVDHGVESPQERKDKGKSEQAFIKLSAQQEEGHIIIQIEDDGKGIDPQKVLRSATAKGFITTETASSLSTNQIIDLIFAPGMSTAEKATELSGRGVGLDIVRTNIERLSGSIELNTQIDLGTKFVIKLPLTVAVFRGLMIAAGKETYIIPIASVVETLKIHPQEIKTVFNGEVMNLRNKVIPLLRLSKVLGIDDTGEIRDAAQYVVIVKAGDHLAGIIVRQLLDQQEFVIKSLGAYLGDIKGIAGATILGDGQAALILDIPTLVRESAYKKENVEELYCVV